MIASVALPISIPPIISPIAPTVQFFKICLTIRLIINEEKKVSFE
jgi:hypothetical protein